MATDLLYCFQFCLVHCSVVLHFEAVCMYEFFVVMYYKASTNPFVFLLPSEYMIYSKCFSCFEPPIRLFIFTLYVILWYCIHMSVVFICHSL